MRRYHDAWWNDVLSVGDALRRILAPPHTSDGLLTVTDVVAETGLSFKKVEKALNAMVDFSRVTMRVSDSGIMVYEFVEILHKDLDTAKTLQELGV
ncbi:MAG: hypothetical protein ABSG17_04850 [Spirochaetia bacterium]